jgi:MOSC domain-containing protein YiiM
VRVTEPSLLAVCRVHMLHPDSSDVGVTAIDKRAVTGPVKVHELGLHGDVQASRKHHGGKDKALYAYSQHDADYWAQELGQDIPPGLFGENLRTAGLGATEAVIGERWRIGADVVVEVTMPRNPCATFQRRMDQPKWVKRFTEAGRVGAYLRVVHKGRVQAGDAISVLVRPAHGITVGDMFAAPTPERVRTLQQLADDGELQLSDAFRPLFHRVLRTSHA